MCFSATASFTTATGLSIISLLSIQKTTNRKMVPLAITPLIFGAQQACEGFVWVTLNSGNTATLLHTLGTYGFLFFAAFWWPMWIPLALYIPEKNSSRKKQLLILAGIGLCSGSLLLFSWLFYTTGAIIISHHIDYPVINYPFGITNKYLAQVISWTISTGYCIATIIPFFISSIQYTWILGIAITTGLITAYIFYLMAFPSVWCFFAAISSLLVYGIIRNYKY
jgi:hypothetical protein